MKLTEIVERVDTLVSLPDVFVRVNDLLKDPTAGATDIGEVISHDPALTARLLKMVNSAIYSFSSPVESVSKAVTIIGTEDLRSLIVATSTVQAFSQIPSELIDMDTFWHRSVFCALTTRELASRIGIRQWERFFVVGLLHDIGKLVLFIQLPELSARVVDEANADRRPLHQIEADLIGYNSAQVGAELMRRWRFPASLWEPVEHQHGPAQASGHKLEASVLHIAVALTNSVEPELKADYAANDEALKVDPEAWQISELTEEEVKSITGLVNMDCMGVLELISPNSTMIF